MKAVIIGKKDERLDDILNSVKGFEFAYCSAEEVLPDTACVLVTDSAEHPAEDVRLMRTRNIPAAAVTFDGSNARQEYWLDRGADRIFVLPMPDQLLYKRMVALAGSAASAASDAGFELFARITESNQQRGAYAVQEADFFNIYRFVQRMQDRADKQSQLVIFRFTTRLQSAIEPGTLEDAFPIVQKCLRRGDLVCMYGENILAILIGADAEGAKYAADRIVNTYQAHFCGSIYDMKYELREIH